MSDFANTHRFVITTKCHDTVSKAAECATYVELERHFERDRQHPAQRLASGCEGDA